MKKNRLLIIEFVITLFVVWLWRYIETQQFYDEHSSSTYVYYPMSEFVPVEDDLIQISESADGYSICVDSFCIVDTEKFAAELGESLENYPYGLENAPDRLALIQVTVHCDGSEDPGIILSDLGLDTVTSTCSLDSFFCDAANPNLSNESYYVSLEAGEEQCYILPYGLREDYYSDKTWHNLESIDFYFRITVAPEAKIVVLNCNS